MDCEIRHAYGSGGGQMPLRQSRHLSVRTVAAQPESIGDSITGSLTLRPKNKCGNCTFLYSNW